MRVTHAQMSRDLLAAIQKNLRGLDRAQRQISSGKRISVSSDDPIAAANVMRMSTELRAFQQFRRNIASAASRIAAEEATLEGITNVLTRARELALSQTGATATPETRAVAAAEVARLIETVTSLGNARVGGIYVFGGDQADRAPFEGTGQLATGITGSSSVEIAPGMLMQVTHNAQEIFGDSGVLSSLQHLHEALVNNDPDALVASAGDLDAAFAKVQELLGDAGARSNHITQVAGHLDALEFDRTEEKSELEDVDFETALIELANQQAALQAALLTTSRILEMNLSDYIR